MLRDKVDKKVRLRWDRKRRSYVSVVREHYFRDDISCKSELCQQPSCRQQLGATGSLLSDCSHYVFPDAQSMVQDLELYHHPSITGLVVTQTVAAAVRAKLGRRAYSQLKNALPTKASTLFSNEHHRECFISQYEEESIEQWQQRLVYQAAVWYGTHLGGRQQIVLVTNDVKDYSSSISDGSVMVLSINKYLNKFYPDLHELHELYQSMAASRAAMTNDASEYPSYRSLQDIKQGGGRFVEGTLRVSRYHPRHEAYVTVSSGSISSQSNSSCDILISGMKHRNRALHCDRVVVECQYQSDSDSELSSLQAASTSSSDLDTGIVVGVTDRVVKDIVASFQEVDDGSTSSILVIPYDVRYPKIRIHTQLHRELRNHRVIVRIDHWNTKSRYPDGHFVRTIGPIGNIEAETEAILVEHQLLRTSFTTAVMKEMPNSDQWMIEKGDRTDLRHSHLIYSIDPQGCEDVDDALSVKRLKNGCIQLGVHIADVSYYVTPGSHTDREARERATTVYLADRRDDMLPAVLSSNLCSLLSGVDRYAVSVIWTLSGSCDVLKVWYGRTIIRSSYKLSYEVAQELFNTSIGTRLLVSLIPELQTIDHDTTLQRVIELQNSIRLLVEIARELKGKRLKQGGVELESVEVKVKLKNDSAIADLLPKQPLEMHEVIAECMIYANQFVASRIYHGLPSSALLRSHPPPQQDKFKELLTCAMTRGYHIDTSSNISLATSLNNAIDDNDPLINIIMRMLATQAMSMAEYCSTGSTNQYYHYGLGLQYYTHFTSPIRRYSDIIVHRQLLTVIKSSCYDTPGNNELNILCRHLNTMKKSASQAQKEHTKMFQLLFFQRLDEHDDRRATRGLVYAIRNNGVMVYLPRYGIEGPVYLKDKISGRVCVSAEEYVDGTITSTNHTITITRHDSHDHYSLSVFDHVLVSVTVEPSHVHLPSFTFKLVSSKPLSPTSYTPFPSSSLKPSYNTSEEEPTALTDELMEYTQRTDTLYCLINHMRTLGQSLPIQQ